MATKNKKPKIFWTDEERMSVYAKMNEYYEKNNNTLPHPKEGGIYQRFQTHLTTERMKLSSYSASYTLKIEFLDWKKKQEISLSNAIRQLEELLPDTVTALVPEEATEVIAESPVEQVVLEEIVSAASIGAEIGKLLEAKLSSVFELVNKLTNEKKELENKLSESEAIANEIASLPPTVIEKVVEKEIVKVVTKEVPVVAKAPVIIRRPNSTSFTEADIRGFIRDEIEKIFGPISSNTSVASRVEPEAPVVELVKPIVETVSKAIEETSTFHDSPVVYGSDLANKAEPVTTPVEDTSTPLSFFVYGLESDSIAYIKNKITCKAEIDGLPFLDGRVKDRAKHADYVILSKFCSHGVQDSLKSYSKTKPMYVSGGKTSIVRKIEELVSKAKETHV